MRIAIFDHRVIKNNPIGSCHRRIVNALADEHEITVFAAEFDNPRPERIKWVKVPAILRPLPLLFITYHINALIAYLFYRLSGGPKPDLIQRVESKVALGDLTYSHFCHVAYLRRHWSSQKSHGVRGFSRWLDHKLHALFEPFAYKFSRRVVVPSVGLRNEIVSQFAPAETVDVIPNALDINALTPPATFSREEFRRQLGIDKGEIVFVFAALGHFERKGLPILLAALSKPKLEKAMLLVVGGTPDLIEDYKKRRDYQQVLERVKFVGLQADVKPFLWASDCFALPSNYETFSLVAYEAAAARLPLITTELHGVDQIVNHGQTGFIVKRNAEEFAAAMRRFCNLPSDERNEMGRNARLAVEPYSEASFVEHWRRLYAQWDRKAAPLTASLTESSG